MRHTGISLFCLGAVLAACSGGFQLDPARSAELAGSAREASTSTGPELRSEDAQKPPGDRPVAADPVEMAIAAALAAADRPAADRERDRVRQSAAVLRFFGLGPGMQVLDLYSGGGYYTEIAARVVGPTGRVVAHNNSPYLGFAKAELASRFAAGRLPNVERLLAENNQLELESGTFDLILMTNVYHDVYFVDEKAGWSRIDGSRLLAELFRALKPGGVLGLTDHTAVTGAPPEVGGTLHRIDPSRVRAELTAAGFVLEEESPVLRNPQDDLMRSAFDPAIRGHTDQMVMRFRRPL
jgi:predicted methyltransferase